MPEEIGTELRLAQKTCHNQPGRVSGPSCTSDTISAHPVRSHHTKDIDGQLDRQTFAPIRRLRELGMPYLPRYQYPSSFPFRHSSPAPTHRNRSSIHPVPKAGNDPTHDHLRNTIRGSLQDRANSKNDGTDHDHPASTKPFARKERKAGAEETPDFVDGNHGALEGGTPVAAVVGIDFRERLDECVSREHCL